jgi:hypothetical protein
VKCMACGADIEGPEGGYDGVCTNKDDKGVETDCHEYEDSCMTTVISINKKFKVLLKKLYLKIIFYYIIAKHNGTMAYHKNCQAVPYHAKGCLEVDEEEVIFLGSY